MRFPTVSILLKILPIILLQPSWFVYVKLTESYRSLATIAILCIFLYSPEKSQLLYIPKRPILEETITFKLYIHLRSLT